MRQQGHVCKAQAQSFHLGGPLKKDRGIGQKGKERNGKITERDPIA